MCASADYTAALDCELHGCISGGAIPEASARVRRAHSSWGERHVAEQEPRQKSAFAHPSNANLAWLRHRGRARSPALGQARARENEQLFGPEGGARCSWGILLAGICAVNLPVCST